MAENHRWASWPLAMASFLLFSVLARVEGAPLPPFCANVASSLFTCPDPPTVDSVDLSKYTGRWYGIGRSAQFAFAQFGARGGQCSSPNYTALGVVNGQNTIKVVNRGILFTSMQRQMQSQMISQGTRAAGLGIRLQCLFLVGTLPFSAILPAVNQVASLLQGMPTPPTVDAPLMSIPLSAQSLAETIAGLTQSSTNLSALEKAGIVVEVAKIIKAVAVSSNLSSAVFEALGNIQKLNNDLNGRTLPKTLDLPATLATIVALTRTVRGLQGQVADQRDAILASSEKILGLGSKDRGVVAAAQGLTVVAGERGPLAFASGAVYAGAGVVQTSADTVLPEPVTPSPNEAIGTAVQNSSQPGALTVSFFGPPTGPNNYKIIQLIGQPQTGYDGALVYSCSEAPGTLYFPEIAFFILSRTPIVPPSTVNSALAFAAQSGILLGGENVFLTVVQDPRVCTNVFP